MTTTQDTATQIRETIAARKADAEQRRIARVIRQEWIEREEAGQAR